jgi:hypothetical protein
LNPGFAINNILILSDLLIKITSFALRRQISRMACFMLIRVYKIICALRREKVGYVNSGDLVKSRNSIEFVIPEKAGIQLFQVFLDPGFRRGDDPRDFLQDHQF